MEQLKNKKAAGPDLIKSELLKNADEEVKKILYNKIQDTLTGDIPSDFMVNKL